MKKSKCEQLGLLVYGFLHFISCTDLLEKFTALCFGFALVFSDTVPKLFLCKFKSEPFNYYQFRSNFHCYGDAVIPSSFSNMKKSLNLHINKAVTVIGNIKIIVVSSQAVVIINSCYFDIKSFNCYSRMCVYQSPLRNILNYIAMCMSCWQPDNSVSNAKAQGYPWSEDLASITLFISKNFKETTKQFGNL